jgi:hypothetical protein
MFLWPHEMERNHDEKQSYHQDIGAQLLLNSFNTLFM